MEQQEEAGGRKASEKAVQTVRAWGKNSLSKGRRETESLLMGLN